MKPFAHQVETVKFLLNNKRAYNFSDLGTGKTLAALWASDFLICNDKIRKVLIVSPLSTMQAVWGNEIFANFPHRKYIIAHGTREYRTKAIQAPAHFVVINHDGVVLMQEEIIRERFDLIIVDELTAFKNHKSNRSKAMQYIAEKAKGVWGLTAIPTPNGPTEAFGQAKVVNPYNPYLPKYYKQFQYSVEQQVAQYIWVPKPDANKIVNKILQPAIRFDRDKCIDIPECVYDTKIVPFTDEQRQIYDKMKNELIVEHQKGLITAANAAVKVMKLLQIAAGVVKDETGTPIVIDSKTRDDYVKEIFEETGRKKLVVFSAFRGCIEHLVELFTKDGARVASIHGDVPHNTRAQHIRDFQEGDLQVLVVQPQSSAHGITLTAANVIVWHSLLASGEIYNQANGRISRAGQTRKQYIIHLIGSKAEQRILNILSGKEDFSESVLTMFNDL